MIKEIVKPLFSLLPMQLFSTLTASAIFAFIFFNQTKVNAQETQKSTTPHKTVKLTEQQWKSVEGIFQSAQNKDMYVQFTAGEDALVAKLLWNNNEIHLLPDSELVFTSKESGEEGPIQIKFRKDANGAVNQVNVAGNGIWNRALNYKPLEKKEMAHSPGQLKPFEGLYQFQNDPSRFIQFSVKENKLILKQHWDGGEIAFVPETQLDFFSREFPLFSLSFTQNKDGNITQVLAFKRDLWIRTKETAFTKAQLKLFEGRFQSKDDPDNLVVIKAINGQLVVNQLWDNKEIVVKPKTDSYFYNEEQSYSLLIIKNKEGFPDQILIMGNLLFNKMK